MSRESDAVGVRSTTGESGPEPVIAVRELHKYYPVTEGILRRETGSVRAVDGISFDVRKGETLGLVGESGCGKSTVARTVLGLEAPTDGRIELFGREPDDLSEAERASLRRRVQMVFQDPKSSFDPRMKMAEAISEPMIAHGLADDERRDRRVETLLELVGLSPSKGDQYPHELSGGEKQRVALARALALDPELLVLDEPVSALDVSVQAEILGLVDELQRSLDLTVLLISHNMSVVQFLCDRVAVMYLGELVESGRTDRLFDDPKHPYTRALLDAVPEPDPADRAGLTGLPGDVPDPASPPEGCRFHTRCPKVVPPDGLDVPQATWRAILALRVALRDGEFDRDAIRERAVAADSTVDDAAAVTEDALCEKIRSEYDVPRPVGDADAEGILEDAIAAAAAGKTDAAAERLADAFPTVCVDGSPETRSVAGRDVACHLYDEEHRGEDDPNEPADERNF